MKTLKYLFAFMLPLFAMATISSCSEDEASYSPAAIPAGDQVYFHSSNAATVNLVNAESTFDVLVSRIDTTKETSVPVVLTCDSLDGYFTLVNENVVFAQGAAQAVVTVAYDGAAVLEALGYGQYVDVVLAFANTDNDTEYGITEYVASVGLPEPWSEWEPFAEGTCDFTYQVLWSGSVDPDLEIEYREYLLNDINAQFKVIGCMNNIELIIDYNRETGNCQVLRHDTKVNSQYGTIWVSDLPHYELQPGLSYENFPCTYDEETGTFNLCLIYWVSEDLGNTGSGQLGYKIETIQVDGFYIPDYSANIEYQGVFTKPDGSASAVVSVGLGADVDSCRVAMFDSYSDENLEALVAGEVEYTLLKEANFVSFPVEATSRKTVIAVTYAGEEPVATNNVTFTVKIGEVTEDDKATIEDYEGDWLITSAWEGQGSYEAVGNIQQVEIEGETYLLCTGFADMEGYDDSFLMLYDAETGYVTLSAQYMANLEYQGTEYPITLYLSNSEKLSIFGGSLIGHLEDGMLVFENAEDNKNVADSWIMYNADFGNITYFNSLEWTRYEAAEAAPAKAPKTRGFKGGLNLVKKTFDVAENLELKETL